MPVSYTHLDVYKRQVVTTPAAILSVYDILNAKYLVVDKDALAKIEEVYA